MTRRADLWSKHTNSVHTPSAGSPFASADSMGALHRSCIRCGTHRPLSALVSDVRVRNQMRCADRGQCASVQRGGA